MDDLIRPFPALICPYCHEYMDFYGEGIDGDGQPVHLYLRLECGQEMHIPQEDPRTRPPRYPWDPPDGHYED